MKKLALTACLAVSVLALGACETKSSYNSGASYASNRTAGETDGTVYGHSKTESVFHKKMSK